MSLLGKEFVRLDNPPSLLPHWVDRKQRSLPDAKWRGKALLDK